MQKPINGGAAAPGRPDRAGTEARPTRAELSNYLIGNGIRGQGPGDGVMDHYARGSSFMKSPIFFQFLVKNLQGTETGIFFQMMPDFMGYGFP